MKKRIGSVLLAGIIALLAVGCGKANAADNKDEAAVSQTVEAATEKASKQEVADANVDELVSKSEAEFDSDFVIKVGDNEPGYYVWKVAEAQGFFEEEFAGGKISVEVEHISGGPAVLEAMAGGEVQFGVAAVDPLINAVSGGADLTTILSIGSAKKGCAIVVRNEANVNSLEELKGHTIAVLFGTSRYNTFLLALKKAGLSPDDVEIMNLSNADTLTAIQSGQVDAAVLTAGISSDIEAVTHVLAYDDEIRDTYHIIIADNKFAKEHPYTTARIVRALVKTNEWIKENKEEAVQIYVNATDVEEKVAEQYYDVRDNVASLPVNDLKAGFQNIIDTVVEYGILETDITSDDILDSTYAELAGLSLE